MNFFALVAIAELTQLFAVALCTDFSSRCISSFHEMPWLLLIGLLHCLSTLSSSDQLRARRRLQQMIPMSIEHIKFSSEFPMNETNFKTWRVRRSRVHPLSIASNVSDILDGLLQNYDRNIRPSFDRRKPTHVYIDIFVRTMGPISELTDTFAFDCYFRQTWKDERLRFNLSSGRELILAMTMLDRIWKPDTFFWNGQESYLHDLTSPNRLMRLSQDGTVLYSTRLTVKAKCHMDMHRFPLDAQACRLVLGSFSYGKREMKFHWKVKGDNVGVQMDYAAIRELPQFDVTGFEVFNSSTFYRDTSYSALEVRFYFRRHVGYFLINFYVPSSLIVLLAWVALWVNREATGDRISLGITCVLSITFLSLDSKSDSPKVDFPTALDVYFFLCYTFLLICMVEFTVVHYNTKFNTGDPEIERSERERMRQLIRSIPKKAVLSSRYYNRPRGAGHPRCQTTIRGRPSISPLRRQRPIGIKKGARKSSSRHDGGRYSMYGKRKLTPEAVRIPIRPLQLPSTAEEVTSVEHQDHDVHAHLDEFHQDSVAWRIYYWVLDHSKRTTDPLGIEENSTSMVDTVARIAVPICFTLSVAAYYFFYVKIPFVFTFKDSFLSKHPTMKL